MSTWMSRAWTYQEASLSRRLLIFTEQVYFEYRSMSCWEEIDGPMELFHLNKDQLNSTNSAKRPFANQSFFPKSIVSKPSGIMLRISEYSKRKLTYDSDTLSGMLRNFNALAQMDAPLYHYLGVP
ncbi:hypothetical protein AOQ84DRAFT_418906, partial [Glonium stellatum]